MARKEGSKLVNCPKCEKRLSVMPDETKECTGCGHKFKVTKKLLAGDTAKK